MKVNPRLIAALKIWIVIYPSLTLVLYLFDEPLTLVPLYVETLLVTLVLVPLVVFIGVPFVERIMRFASEKQHG